MPVSNKKFLLALALFAPEEVASFAIPSSGTMSCGRTASVTGGDDCISMARQCKISQDTLTSLNPEDAFCTTLRQGQVVCCSRGIQARSPAPKKGKPQQSTGKPQQSKDKPQQSADKPPQSTGKPQQQSTSKPQQSTDQTKEKPQDINNDDQKEDDGANADNKDDNSKGPDGEKTIFEKPDTKGGDQEDDGQGDGQNDGQDDVQTGDQGDGKDNEQDGQDDSQPDDQGDGQGDVQGDDQGDVQGDGKEDGKDDGKDNGKKGGAENDDTNPAEDVPSWQKLTCDKKSAAKDKSLTPEKRWDAMGAPAAFQWAVDQFKKDHGDKRPELPSAIMQTLTGTVDYTFPCQDMGDDKCSKIAQCEDFRHEGTGPAGMLIQNSFVNLRSMYTRADKALDKATGHFQPSITTFIRDFAPKPPPKADNSKWLDFFLDIFSMGAAAGLGRVVKLGINEFSTLAKAADKNDVKAATETLLGGAMDLIGQRKDKRELPGWDENQQQDLVNVFSLIFKAWSDSNIRALEKVFANDDDSITKLGNLINHGKMVSNTTDGSQDKNLDKYVDHFGTMMFATAAPQAWRLSDNMAFILDMGVKCDAKDIDWEKSRIDPKKMDNGKACIDNQLYYLAMVPKDGPRYCPPGANRPVQCPKMMMGECPEPIPCTDRGFEQPPGLDSLDGKHAEYANVKAADIVEGSVKTFKANGNKNGAKGIDIKDADVFLGMAEDKPNLPGMYRLPICNLDTAVKGWKDKKRTDNDYPC